MTIKKTCKKKIEENWEKKLIAKKHQHLVFERCQRCKKQAREEIEKELRRRLTEVYFVFSEIDKPDFKRAVDAQNWYDQQNWIAEKMVGSWVDNTMVIYDQAFSQNTKEVVSEIKCRCMCESCMNCKNSYLNSLKKGK